MHHKHDIARLVVGVDRVSMLHCRVLNHRPAFSAEVHIDKNLRTNLKQKFNTFLNTTMERASRST